MWDENTKKEWTNDNGDRITSVVNHEKTLVKLTFMDPHNGHREITLNSTQAYYLQVASPNFFE